MKLNNTLIPVGHQYPSIIDLPSELLLEILNYLDIPDLLALSRTAHHLRTHSLDPLLHLYRIRRASCILETYIPLRPPLTQLMHQRIYITRTSLAARNLGRSLIKIKLNRKLTRRPNADTLVELGVLPKEWRRGIAPGIIETKRKVERERVKDVLRGWVDEWRQRGMREKEGGEGERPNVSRLARRFAREEKRGDGIVQRWGRGMADKKEDPTRAKVLGLRRFWEGVGKEGKVA